MKGMSTAAALLVAAAALGTTSCSRQEAGIQPGPQTTCPVMKGRPIDPKMYVDVNGKRIYACCSGCLAQIKADPEKYIHEMETEGMILEVAPE